jgi:GT2 family glycosyltransferase
MEVCFVTAMYRNGENVRSFVEHVRSLPGGDEAGVHIIIANNGGESVAPMPGALIFDPGRNLGYLPGCAWALDRWLERGSGLPEWVCISNTDLRLESDFLLALRRDGVADDAGVVAPDIRLSNGARQNPILWKRPARLMMLAYAVLSRLALFMPIFEASVRLRHALRRGTPPPETSIYAAHGSLFLLHRRYFERGGTLQYRGTMYGEEIHIAEQARRAGLRVVWQRALRAEHQQHSTTRSVSSSQRRLWHEESAAVLWSEYWQ